jgi:hypothetical protein
MGVMSSKMGSAGAFPRRDTSERLRRPLMGRLSNLLSHLGSRPKETASIEDSREVERAALRQRMTPPPTSEDVPLGVILRRSERTHVPAAVLPIFEAQSNALEDFPWPGEGAAPDWKPVLLSDDELVPGLPTLDELAEEGATDLGTPRFPVDL